MTEYHLYDYQQDLVNKVLQKIPETDLGKGIMAQSQAGSGKTVMMADIAKRITDKNLKILFLVHRIEIVAQATATFKDYGVNMDLAKMSMIQSYANELKKGNDYEPDVIFIDEAHHAESNTYLKVLEVYQQKALKTQHPIPLLFFTATPYRLDNKNFLNLVQADNLILGVSTKELIRRKRLAPFKFYEPSRIDMSKLERKGKHGDYTNESMAEAVKNISPQDLVNTYKKYCKNGEQALIYASNVEYSKQYAKAFNDAGITAYHLDGASNSKERANVIERYRKGEVKVLSNVEIFTEGLDLPNASVGFLVRPTQSLSLYIQFAMRVLRYKEGKVAKIFDFAGLHDTFGLPDTNYRWSLQADDPMKTADVGKTKKCPECNYIFELPANTEHQKTIKCPNCEAEIVIIKPKSDSPFNEYYDEDISQREIMINSFSELDNQALNPRETIKAQLPLYVNYQLARYQLAEANEDTMTTFQKLLREYKAPFYPTYFELSETEKYTRGYPNQQQMIDMIENNNQILNKLIDSKADMSVSFPLKRNFEIVQKKIKALTDEDATPATVLTYMFQKMKNAKFREYFAINVNNLNAKQIQNMLGIKFDKYNEKIINTQKEHLNTFFNSIGVPLRQVFNAQIFDVQPDNIRNCFVLCFKDSYGKKYHQAVTPATIVRLAPPDKKKTVMETKDGYKTLINQYIKALPIKNKQNSIIFKFNAL